MKDYSGIQGMFLDVFAGGNFNGVLDILGYKFLGAGAKYGNASELVHEVYINLMVPIAVSLLVIYFVIALIEKSTNEQFTYEQLFLLLAKMVIGIFIISKGWDILKELQDIGLKIFDIFKYWADESQIMKDSQTAELGNEYKEFFKELTGVKWPGDDKQLGFMKSIQAFIGGGFIIIPAWIFQQIVVITIYAVVFLRIMEIYIRAMFAPLALSDIFYNGLNSTGFRFLKSFLAVFLQVIVIYGCILLYIVIGKDLTAEPSMIFLVKHLAMTAATLGVVLKSQTLIKEFIGAN